MPLPVDYDTVPVRGRYVYLDGSPAVGQIRFTGKVVATSDATDTIIVPTTIITPLDEDGQFLVHLPATDDPDIQPNGWTYTVTEELTNGGGRTFDIDVPLSAKTSGIDLSEVAPLSPASGDPTAFITRSQYDSLAATVMGVFGFMDNAIEAGLRVLDNSLTLASGRAEFSYVRAYRTQTITQLGVATRSPGVTGLTGARRALYVVNPDGSLTMVARTALITTGYNVAWTEWVSPLDTTGGFPASYTMEYGKLYALGHTLTCTGTPPNMKAYSTNSPSSLLNRSPKVAVSVANQTDLATSYSAAQVAAAAGNALYQFALA